jgi:hypothetical protein
MQTLKFLFATGALAAVILPLQVQAAPDNAEQAKMREALRRMMESNPPAGEVTAVAPPAAPAAVPAAAPVVPAAAPKKPMFGAVPPPSQPGVAPVVPPPGSVPAATVVVVQSEQATFGPVPPPDDSANLAQAREVMRQKVMELAMAQSTANPLAPAATAYTAIQVPSSPLSASQQSRLAELLVRYKADTITAQEYHKERAAIIATP